MNLYFIAHEDDEEDFNRDLLLRCATPEEAIDLWRAHWMVNIIEGDEEGERVKTMLPDLVFIVNETTNGVLPWHRGDGCLEVTTHYHAVATAKKAFGI